MMDYQIEANEFTENAARGLAASYPARVFFFLLIHVPLGLLISRSPFAATLHALGLLALGGFMILRDHRPHRIVYVLTYMAGAEALWRLRTALNFEYVKYAIGLLLVLGLLRYMHERRVQLLPLAYLLLLLPAIVVMPIFSRNVVVFNLAGPALMAICAMFFSTMSLNDRQLRHAWLAMLAPIISIASIAIISTVTTETLVFTGATNPITSGGDGGNQISALLGLGAVLALLLAVVWDRHQFLRGLMLLLLLDLVAQSAFTFSRGGFFTALGAILLMVLLLLRDRRLRVIILIGMPIVLGLAVQVVFPALNDFTGGKLFERLQSLDPTGRDAIALVDLQLFVANPVQGVGLGESIYAHVDVFRLTQPHTEVTRMLAEHGMLGLLALVILIYLAGRYILGQPTQEGRIYATIMLAWAIVTTMHIGMRLAAPALLFGLCAAKFTADRRASEPPTETVPV